jgi:hypothetical protein
MRGLREVSAGQHRRILITVAASDPILLAVAHGELALASDERASTRHRRSFQMARSIRL